MGVGYILSSNLVQTFLTFTSGILLFWGIRKFPTFLSWVAAIVAGGIFYSFLFSIGEVYSYAFFYKRAFLFFGDNISTILVFLFVYCMALGKKYASALCISAIFMSGGKVSYILLMLTILILSIFGTRLRFKAIASRYLRYIAIGILVYFSMIGYTRLIDYSGAMTFMQSAYVTTRDAVVEILTDLNSAIGWQDTLQVQPSEAEDPRDLDITVRGGGACSQMNLAECFFGQLKAAFKQRFFSSTAGLWMTLQGGFRGINYPGTATEFAQLMTTHNPWDINNRYDLTFSDWQKIGQVQNPYLLFGSGYGVIGFTLLFSSFMIIAYLGIKRLIQQRNDLVSACSAFFVINAVFNQSQPWILPRSSILLAMGICAGFIVFGSTHKSTVSSVRPPLISSKLL